MMNGKWCLLGGALLALTAVALGAFGAHALQGSVQSWGLDAGEQAKRLHNWEVGVRYQMYHALGLLLVGVLCSQRPGRLLDSAAALLTIGATIFSGCLYAYVLTGQKIFGMIVPIGGVLMLGGWLLLAIVVARWPAKLGMSA